MNIGIALLYGLYNPTRTNYKGYLDFISKKTIEEKLDKLILCGGYTDPKQPTISEAGSVKKYINSTNTEFDKFVLEESSTNTNPYKPFVYKNLKVLTYDFPNRTKEETIGQSFAALLDVMALYNPEFNKMDLEQRKKDFGLA